MRAARSARTLLVCVALVGLGAVTGLVGVFQHPAFWTVADQRLGVGVLAGILALLLAQYVSRDALPPGLGPALVLLGWTAVVLVLGSSRPEGDIALPAGLAGEGFLYGGFLAGMTFAAVQAIRATGAARAGR